MKLGDLIEKITTVTGIKKLVGDDCKACQKRKKKLNKINAISTACWVVLLTCCVMALISNYNGYYQGICDWAVIGTLSVIIMFYSLAGKK
jgi:hypothetical protein